MSHHFPDQTGFQHILEYIGLRCDFICQAAVSDTMDHVQCLGNLPSEIALATQLITMAVMEVASQINRDYGKITEDPGLPHPWWSNVNQQLPEHYQELRWEELLGLYAEFIPRCLMLVLSPKIHTTKDLMETERLELARRQAVLTQMTLAREITQVDAEMRAAMKRIVELEAFWPAKDIFDALSGHHDDK
ncbi:hypothetical protein PAXRUDRAFT_19275 [Paxillus rubicundulus Ve08.2h10]|uniref:Uncharacterized protein n=1 Tax=Paxillus rubicundulus Ve08.2h10 TaxID=930991 RepID=A0A0D0CIU3_9AGAM|nr:hypothetical protein PAXRUDRAFT_19275 [Paxillus rubicundulus Ve08.2h10]